MFLERLTAPYNPTYSDHFRTYAVTKSRDTRSFPNKRRFTARLTNPDMRKLVNMASRRDLYLGKLAQVSSHLPSRTVLQNSASPEIQARACLHLLLESATVVELTNVQAFPEEPDTCPNCASPTTSSKTPYCSPDCRNESSFVRQFRGAVAEDTILEPERQEGIGQVFWYLVGGGRPLRQHLIPDRTKADLLRKGNGACALCGAPATSIDHILSGCNRPINLRITCDACCRTRPFGDARVVNSSGYREILSRLAFRIGSPIPLRVSDDPLNWDWRAYLKSRA
jgi:hypothetical protein